jgi:hypothetical protein
VIVGTSGAAFGPIGRWEVAAAEADVAEAESEIFAGSGMLLLGVLGCDFHSQLALLDSTATEKATAVTSVITTINNVAGLLTLV